MQMRWHTGDSTRKNLATFGHEFLQEIRILVVDCFNRDVDAAARHRAIGTTKGRAPFGRFRLHGDLFRLAMEGVFTQKGIVFLLFQSIGRTRALFISRAHVTRDRFAERFSLVSVELLAGTWSAGVNSSPGLSISD